MLTVLIKAPGKRPERMEIHGLGDLAHLLEGPVDGFHPILGNMGVLYSTTHRGAPNIRLRTPKLVTLHGPCAVLRRNGFEPVSLYNPEADFNADDGAWAFHFAQGYLRGAAILEHDDEG